MSHPEPHLADLLSPAGLVFVVLPFLMLLAVAVVSFSCAARAFSVIQILLSAVVIGASLWSMLVFINITLGAWPTFLPHIVGGAAVAVCLIQLALVRRGASRPEKS